MAGSNTTSNPTFTYKQTANYTKGALIVIPFGIGPTTHIFKGPIPFALNPETITESLTGGWVHKAVPGQNDPISTWVGNGNRTVSLTLLIINDTSTQNTSQAATANPYGQSILGAIGAAVAKIPVPVFKNLAPSEPATVGNSSQQPQDITITQQVDQLRQLRYGILSKNGLYVTPPSLVKFQFDGLNPANANNTSNATLGGGTNSLDNVYWTVDALEINTTKWTSTLQPLEAEVKLTLVQFNDINRSQALTSGTGNLGGASTTITGIGSIA
jgi:hypothetical protein